jgi:hypothetical protein
VQPFYHDLWTIQMTFYVDNGIKPAKENKLRPHGFPKYIPKKASEPKSIMPKYKPIIIIHNDKEYRLIDKNILESYPEAYELVTLLLDEPEIRLIPGWHVGNKTFGGYRWNDKMNVKAWKIRQGDH